MTAHAVDPATASDLVMPERVVAEPRCSIPVLRTIRSFSKFA